MPVTFYPKNFVMQCGHCKTYGRLNSVVSVSQLPIALICTACDGIMQWDSIPILPKVTPGIEFTESFIVGSLKEKEEVEQQREYAKPESFYVLAEKVSENASSLFKQLDELQNHITNFKIQIKKFYKEKFGQVHNILEWNDSQFLQFLKNPFNTIQIACDNELTQSYTHWLVYPAFIKREYGIPVSRGVLNVDLISQFTRLKFPMETALVDMLNLPVSLDLEVRGTKILGSSLPFCWKDIPGTIKDIDHSEEWPSIVIRDPKQAKLWLVNHGVNPWQKQPLRSSEIVDWEMELDSLHFKEAWKNLILTGRQCVFWPQKDLREVRKYAYFISKKIQGTNIIFTANESSKRFYEAVFSAYSGITSRSKQQANRVVLMAPGEPLIWDAIFRTNTVIVDLYGGVNNDILENLFSYKGRVILIGPDPVMDLQREGRMASLVYGLAGWPVFMPMELRRVYFDLYRDGQDIESVIEFLKIVKEKT